MKKLLFIVTVLSTTPLFISCKKEIKIVEPIEENCDCETIYPIPGDSYGYEHVHDTSYYLNPVFNPNNSNEIAFIDTDFYNYGMKIYRYNLITKQKQLVFSGLFQKTLNWTSNDWIIFQQNDFKLYKIKSNGDSLTQINHAYNYFHPAISKDGSKMVVLRVGTAGKSYLIDMDGNEIDSLENWVHNTGNWNSSNLFAGISSHNRLKIINPETNELHFNKLYPSTIQDFVWLNEYEGIYSTTKGLYKLNYLTKTEQKIKCGCNSRTYRSGSLNSDGTKLVYTRSVLKHLEPTILLEDLQIVIMNIDGSDEEEIIIE